MCFDPSVWSLSTCSVEGTVLGPLYTQDLIDSSHLRSEVGIIFPTLYMRKWRDEEVKDSRLQSMN